MRSTSFAFLTLLALAVALPAAAQQAIALKPMTLTYQILVQGNALGTLTTTLAQEGEEWAASTSFQGPMSQESQLRFRRDLTPVSSHMTASQGPIAMESELHFAQGHVTGTAKLPAQMGGDRQVDAQVAAGTLFPEMESWFLALAPLEVGKSFTISTFNAMTGGNVNGTYAVAGTESVTVPGGTFEAYRVDVTGLPAAVSLFLRKEGPHIMLKQESPAQSVSVVLQSMK
jgi:hypothetical protein